MIANIQQILHNQQIFLQIDAIVVHVGIPELENVNVQHIVLMAKQQQIVSVKTQPFFLVLYFPGRHIRPPLYTEVRSTLKMGQVKQTKSIGIRASEMFRGGSTTVNGPNSHEKE
ncbi:MAG: hypothetical protein EZS28_013390 [Streblomastix strix]|uniref:Uncharacterized protein n=1 Tax=Streblomastix strix TaxID=222440 RepID=A0A5J4W881_9EUKA|nr:MAG: hypothetical protein EZS28_013390 [Streblomastix strix]